MNQQKEESKLEHAAKEYAQPKIVSDDFIYPQSALIKIKKETFITAVKSEAAKEYWQSLTTPSSNEPLFRWVNMEVRLPEEGVEVFFDGGENPPMFGSIKYNGKHPSILVYDSSGEEEYLPVSDYEQWLEPITPSKPHTVEEGPEPEYFITDVKEHNPDYKEYGERMFTLEEMKDCWNVCESNQLETINSQKKKQYFKQKFNIDL